LIPNIAAELRQIASDQLTKPVKNIVLNLSNLVGIEESAAETISVELQQIFL
jgi:hypothetical protein